MKLRQILISFVCGTTFLFVFSQSILAIENASPKEVIDKVKEARDVVAKEKEKSFSEFMKKDGKWVWKDTYIWVLHCKKGTNATHPISPALVGKDLTGIKDVNGKMFFVEFCNKAKLSGGWVEYLWPKPEEKTPSKKITYVLPVPGTDYAVAAGIYPSQPITIEELDKIK